MPTKISSVADIGKFYLANPTALPTISGRSMDSSIKKPGEGQGPIYSTVSITNQDGTLRLLGRSDNNFSVYRVSDNAFLGTLPLNANPVDSALNPRWTRDGHPLETIWCANGWGEIRRHPWNDPSKYQIVATAPAGKVFVDNGGEGDLSDDGRYMAILIADPYDGAVFPNPMCGVLDIQNKKILPGMIPGKPNAIDISPDGVWMSYTDHLGTAASEPNKFYRISDLAVGTVKAVPVDSFINNGNKSIGHHGWTKLATGETVMVYADNQDDGMKFFNPSTGKSTLICSYLEMFGHYAPDPGPYGGLHIGRKAPAGWFLLSTYDCTKLPDGTWHPWANAVVHVEIATKKGVVACPTNTARSTYWTESPATSDDKNIYFMGNNGGTEACECWTAPIPDLSGGTVPPVVNPPTPTPVPAPILIQATQGGKPIILTLTIG